MNRFTFQNTTKIYFGDKQLAFLGEEIKRFGNRILLVYGGGSIKKTGLYQRVVRILNANKINIVELSGVDPNPRHTSVNEGARLCKLQNIDLVLAVGGGSTIDCAKFIAAAACYPGNGWDLVTAKAPITKALPIITVLTLAASGSEMNAGAVISNLETNEKYGLLDPHLQPEVSFLNPAETVSVNAFQTACGCVDTIAHVLDVHYFARGKKMEMVSNMMETVVKTAVKYGPIACQNPKDLNARENLMWASTWALNRFLDLGNISSAPCHMIEHEVSAYHDITHGLGLAILMPRWIAHSITPQTARSIYQLGRAVFDVKEGLKPTMGAALTVDALSAFLFDVLQFPSSFKEINITSRYFKAMAQNACRNGPLDCFYPLDEDDVLTILKNSL